MASAQHRFAQRGLQGDGKYSDHARSHRTNGANVHLASVLPWETRRPSSRGRAPGGTRRSRPAVRYRPEADIFTAAHAGA